MKTLVFRTAACVAGLFMSLLPTLGCGADASVHRGQTGQQFTYTCPPNFSTGRAWGTDIYTDDSEVCTAAVHAGRITRAAGGVVTIEMRPGQNAYVGSTRYGVTSENWGAFSGSYVFPLPRTTPQAATPRPPAPPPTAANRCDFKAHVQVYDRPSPADYDVCVQL